MLRSLKLLPVLILVAGGLISAPVHAVEEQCPDQAPHSGSPQWPAPVGKKAFDTVHFGEAHWNEGQGPLTMPELVQDVVSYKPNFVTFSSDIADVGTVDRLACFRQIMRPIDARNIPWFDSPGNHDRVAAAGPGGVANGSIDIWRQVFADMPAPWGDAKAPKGFLLPKGEPDDGKGASTHYYVDYAPKGKKPSVRIIVLDNSEHSLTLSDRDQYPAVGVGAKDAGQLAFLERVAAEAHSRDLMTWVVMHQPTQDPRDLSNVHPVSLNHTMGKGASPDNRLFDAIASVNGVDAVFMGHIQGNVTYRNGDTEYFIDGGGGGSPYALTEVGTDTGYFYGFRVVRVARDSKGTWAMRSYLVPLIDRIKVDGPDSASVGDELQFSATALQPFDPELPARFGLAPNEQIEVELRHVDPTRIDAATVPQVAYMWSSSDVSVLRPLGDTGDPLDDPSFDATTMTMSGRFEAVGAGTATIAIASGTHVEYFEVTVR